MGEKSGPNATFNLNFLGLGRALGWGVRRIHSNICMLSNPTEFSKSLNTLFPSSFEDKSTSITLGQTDHRFPTINRSRYFGTRETPDLYLVGIIAHVAAGWEPLMALHDL